MVHFQKKIMGKHFFVKKDQTRGPEGVWQKTRLFTFFFGTLPLAPLCFFLVLVLEEPTEEGKRSGRKVEAGLGAVCTAATSGGRGVQFGLGRYTRRQPRSKQSGGAAEREGSHGLAGDIRTED